MHYRQLSKSDRPLDKRRCCESDQPALPLLRDSQFLVQFACQKDLEALRLLGKMLELNNDTPIESMNRDIAIDLLCTKAYLLLRNYKDNVLEVIKNEVKPKIEKKYPSQNNDSDLASNSFFSGIDDAITAKSIETIETELIKLAAMEMVIVVGVMVNAGKSTTINAIVGFELLPERNTPMTLLPTLIRHKPGQLVPKLSIKDPKKLINDLIERLELRELDENNKKTLKSCKSQLHSQIREDRIIAEEPDVIFKTLSSLNDLFSLSSQLDEKTLICLY